MTYEIKPNDQFKSLEIYFSDKPETATREALKALKFRWNPKKSCWYGFADLATLSETLENVTGSKPEDNAVLIPGAEFVDGGGLYDGWQGGNYSAWKDTDELKAQLKAAFKKAGLKVSIREKRASCCRSLYFTWTINRSHDIETFENFRKKYGNDNSKMFPLSHCTYKNDDGTYSSIYIDEYYKLVGNDPEKAEKIKNGHLLYEYENEIEHGLNYHDTLDALTDEANQKRQLLKDIVKSFNRDCSNGMIDYFDRSFYDHYVLKVID